MRLGPEDRGCPDRAAAASGAAITWYGPAGPGDEQSNERWCETVGSNVLEPLPRASFPSLGPADSIAVVAWNIMIGGGDVPLLLEEVLGYDCHPTSPELEAGFSHFVLLIQEAHRRSEAIPDVPESFKFPPRIEPESPPDGWPDIVELARECGLALFYVPSARNGPQTIAAEREDKGNAILSTLSLKDLIAIELPFEAGRKVAVAATIAGASGTRLRVASVHLDVASTLYRTLTTANTARLRQATGLIEALALIETGGVTSGIVPGPPARARSINCGSASPTRRRGMGSPRTGRFRRISSSFAGARTGGSRTWMGRKGASRRVTGPTIRPGSRGSVSASRFASLWVWDVMSGGVFGVQWINLERNGILGMNAFESRSRPPSHRRLLGGLSLSAVGLAALVGCGDISEFVKPITPAEISGEWHATDLVLTNANDPTISFDPIAAGGAAFLRFSIDGGYQQIIQTPGQDDDVEIGAYEIVDDFILVELDSAPGDTTHFAYEFQTSKTAFTLTLLSDDLDYDFGGVGNQVPALLFAIFIR
jgi:hypothetical protein